jgi:hypothetical protein
MPILATREAKMYDYLSLTSLEMPMGRRTQHHFREY